MATTDTVKEGIQVHTDPGGETRRGFLERLTAVVAAAGALIAGWPLLRSLRRRRPWPRDEFGQGAPLLGRALGSDLVSAGLGGDTAQGAEALEREGRTKAKRARATAESPS